MKLLTVLSLFLTVAVALPADGPAPAESGTATESAAPTQTPDDLYKRACLDKYQEYAKRFECGKAGSNPVCETVARKSTCIWNPECRRYINCPCNPCLADPSEPEPSFAAQAVEASHPAGANLTKEECEKKQNKCIMSRCGGYARCAGDCFREVIASNPECKPRPSYPPSSEARNVEADSPPVAQLLREECMAEFTKCLNGCNYPNCAYDCKQKVRTEHPECRRYVKRQAESVPRDVGDALLLKEECKAEFNKCLNGCSYPNCASDCKKKVRTEHPECRRYVKRESESEPAVEADAPVTIKDVSERECHDHYWNTCGKKCGWVDCQFNCRQETCRWNAGCKKYRPFDTMCFNKSEAVARAAELDYKSQCEGLFQNCRKTFGAKGNCERMACMWHPVASSMSSSRSR